MTRSAADACIKTNLSNGFLADKIFMGVSAPRDAKNSIGCLSYFIESPQEGLCFSCLGFKKDQQGLFLILSPHSQETVAISIVKGSCFFSRRLKKVN